MCRLTEYFPMISGLIRGVKFVFGGLYAGRYSSFKECKFGLCLIGEYSIEYVPQVH